MSPSDRDRAGPYDVAGPLCLLGFDYARPMLAKGARRPLQYEDLEPLAQRDNVHHAICKVQRAWDSENTRAAKKGVRPFFLWALIAAFRRDVYVGSILSFLEDLSLLAQVILIRPLLKFLVDPSSSAAEGYQLAFVLACCSLAQALLHHQNFLVNMRGGWNFRISVTGVLHAKLLRLTQQALHDSDSASIYNLIASDANRFDNVAPMLHLGYTAFFASIVIVVLLAQALGWPSALAGSSTMVAFIVLQIYFGKEFGRRRGITAKITDGRVRLTTEMLGGVSSVKAYAWEDAFLARVSTLRAQEHGSIFASQSMKACTLALYFAAPALASLVMYSVYTRVEGKELKVEDVYSAVALLNLLRVQVGMHMAKFLEFGPEAYVAVKRMQRFLELPEVAPKDKAEEEEEGGGEEEEKKEKNKKPKKRQKPRHLQRPYLGYDQEVKLLRSKRREYTKRHRKGKGPTRSQPAAATAPAAVVGDQPQQQQQRDVGGGRGSDQDGGGGGGVVLCLEHASFSRSAQDTTNNDNDNALTGLALENIDLAVPAGSVCVVSGAVGAGKSTLLEGILGELPLVGGTRRLRAPPEEAAGGAKRRCVVALSPQEPWIMAGTVEANILFGLPRNEGRFQRVLDVCALRTDVEQLPRGLNTEIGEKGVNLSGGQKARISLARACYCKADLVLLDDPLSAVDPGVAHHLFHKCILGWLAKENGCAVVLVTHQRQFMASADHILVLESAPPSAQPLLSSAFSSSSSSSSSSPSSIQVFARSPTAAAAARNPALPSHVRSAHASHVSALEAQGRELEAFLFDALGATSSSSSCSSPVNGATASGGGGAGSSNNGSGSKRMPKKKKKKPVFAVPFIDGSDVELDGGDDDSGQGGHEGGGRGGGGGGGGGGVGGEEEEACEETPEDARQRSRAFEAARQQRRKTAATAVLLKLRLFGVDTLRDLKDEHLVNASTLAHEMGLTPTEALALAAAVDSITDPHYSSSSPTASGQQQPPGPLARAVAAETKKNKLLDGGAAADAATTTASSSSRHANGNGAADDESMGGGGPLVGRVLAQGSFPELSALGLVSSSDLSAHDDQGDEDNDQGDEDNEGEGDDGDDDGDEDNGARADQDGDGGGDGVGGAKEGGGKSRGEGGGVKEKSASGNNRLTALVGAEDRELGVVKWSTWVAYLTASGTPLAVLVLVLFSGGQILLLITDWWLLVWASAKNQNQPYLLGTYVALCLGTVAVSFCRALLFFFSTLKASSTLHNLAASSLFKAPLSFFAATPSGRIINRFSADLSQVDEQLAVALFDTLQISCLTGAGLCVACVVLPPVIALVPPVLGTMIYLRQYTTASMRELKRMDGITRSPVYSSFRAALHGLTCIRAYGREDQTQRTFEAALAKNAKTWYWWLIANRWFGFWLDVLCAGVVTTTALVAVAMKDSTDPGLIGLALVYILGLSGMFQYMMRQSALVETYMTSVERLNHYAHRLESEEVVMARALLPSPAATASSSSSSQQLVVAPSWPERGEVVLSDLRVRYREDLPQVIKGVSATVKAGTKVGVVGRTGSGKSSLLLALGRMNEVCGGSVQIDGVDVSSLPLPTLRRAIAVIPQEPHLFSGTVRFNLDPDGTYSDAEVWDALEACRLKELVMGQQHSSSGGSRWSSSKQGGGGGGGWGQGLDSMVEEGGSNWSVGQRQLLSIARALLHRRKIVLLDEATASVDFESDQAIQLMLRASSAFKNATLIVIAHRIDTIIDSDQVLVMDHGVLAESGDPQDLLNIQGGIFASMVAASRNKAHHSAA